MYSVLEYLFHDKYQFKRPYIANYNVNIENPEEQIKDMILNSDEISISDIMEFAKESHYDIYSILELLNSFNDTHALMNQQYLVFLAIVFLK